MFLLIAHDLLSKALASAAEYGGAYQDAKEFFRAAQQRIKSVLSENYIRT